MATPRVRLGVIGAGMIGRIHAHVFSSLAHFDAPVRVDLAVIADPIAPLAESLRQEYGFERTAGSWEELAEARDVDAVIVGLPNYQHRGPVEALLAAGKHVFSEKPLAHTARDARAMLRAAERSGRVHAVGFNQRLSRGASALRRLLAGGELGAPWQLSGRYLTDYASSPEVPYTWRYQRSLAGSGALGDIGSHVLDTSRFLLGEVERIEGAALATFIAQRPIPAEHVVGHAKVRTTGEYGTVDTDDVAAFQARFRGGALADFRFNRIASGVRNSPTLELVAERGTALFDMEHGEDLLLYDRPREAGAGGSRLLGPEPLHPDFPRLMQERPLGDMGIGYHESFLAQALGFARAAAGLDAGYRPNFEDGYAISLICEAVQRAAEQGRAVEVAAVAAEAEQG
jgi:predicted dehydrogenase